MVRALGEVIDTGRDLVLVVDDGSPDGTGEIADRLAAELPWVRVLHRERKEGLGRAYLAAFDGRSLSVRELVLEIDCDFSHDPAVVPHLIAACENGADVALGSRYVAGGGTGNWGLRGGSSRGAGPYARSSSASRPRPHGRLQVLPPRVLEAIDLQAVTGRYAFQIEMTYRALMQGFRVVELPITFVDREWAARDVPSDRARGDVEGAALRLRALRGRL